MVFITPFVGAAALLSGFAAALPRPDSSINEPAVSAPNGTPITDTSSPSATSSSSSDSSSYSGSSYGSSGSYGSSDSMGSYGSSDSSYGSGGSYGSNDNYGYGSNSDTSSTAWVTSSALSTSTSTAWQSYSTPSYGSGSSNWDGSDYNNCVQQCVASYGGLPPATYTPTATNSANYGSGATHTVIVAPTQGVLRYIPFAVNASVGDTIKFMWGANNHTVTKSSELQPCNKSSDALFTSGTHDKDFVFTQVVNDTSPTFFYCGTPTHCEKGMFGIINPPSALGAPTSVSGMMQSLGQNNSDIAAYSSYVTQKTSGNSGAARWGGSIDIASLPEWSHSMVAENVLYTRTFLAANAEVLKEDGTVDLGGAATAGTPLMIPQDLSVALKANSDPSNVPAAPNAPAATSAASDAAPTTTTNQNLGSGAMSVSSSKVVVALVAAVATFLML